MRFYRTSSKVRLKLASHLTLKSQYIFFQKTVFFIHLCNVLAFPHPNFAQVSNNQR